MVDTGECKIYEQIICVMQMCTLLMPYLRCYKLRMAAMPVFSLSKVVLSISFARDLWWVLRCMDLNFSWTWSFGLEGFSLQ